MTLHISVGGGIFTFRMLRGIAGMGLGYIVAYWYSHWNLSEKVTLSQKFFVGMLECFLLFLLFKWTVIKSIPNYLIIIILIFISLFCLFLAQRGFLSRMLNNNICFQLGKYCYSIYLVQEFMTAPIKKFLWNNPNFGVLHYPAFNIFAAMFLMCIAGVIVYYLIEKPFYKIIKKKLG